MNTDHNFADENAPQGTAPARGTTIPDALGPSTHTPRHGAASPNLDDFKRSLFAAFDRQIANVNRTPRRFSSKARFTRRRWIGGGGLGDVYEALDRKVGRIVAVKISKSVSSWTKGEHDRFYREYRLTARLQHPGIPPVYAAGRLSNGRRFYSMRLVVGQTLSEIIRRERSLLSHQNRDERRITLLKLLACLKDVSNTVHAAHEAGYLHLDLKPDNVMVEPSGATFVVDWGLAEPFSNRADVMPSRSHRDLASLSDLVLVAGTPEFMAPEQLSGRSAGYDARTDVFALSGILHMILTGNPARVCANEPRGTRFWSIFRKAPITNIADVAGQVHGRAIPRELVSICERGLAVLPEDRYASAAEFREDIQRWERGEFVIAHRGKYGLMEGVSRWVAHHVQVVVPAALTMMILIFSLLILNWQQSRVAQHRADADRHKLNANTSAKVAVNSLQNLIMLGQNEKVLRDPELIPLRLYVLRWAWKQYEKWDVSAVENRDQMLQIVQQLHHISRQINESFSEQILLDLGGETLDSTLAIEWATQVCRRLLAFPEGKNEARLLLATSYRLGATLERDHGNPDEAMVKAELAVNTLRENKDASLDDILESLRIQSLIAEIDYDRAMRSTTIESRRRNLFNAAERIKLSLDVTIRMNASDRKVFYECAMIESQAAIINHKLGRLDEALAHSQRGLGLLNQNQIPAPIDDKFDSDWVRTTRLHARMLNSYGLTLCVQKKFQAALDSHKQARDLRAEVVERFPWLLRIRRDLAQSYGNIADTLTYVDDIEAEIAARREAVKLLRQMFEDYPSAPGIKEFWALHRVRIIVALHRAGFDDRAAQEFVETLAVCPEPELAEPTNSVHLMDVALEHCLASRIGNTPEAHRQEAVRLILRIDEMTGFVDIPNQQRLLTDSAFESLRNVDAIKTIVERIRQ